MKLSRDDLILYGAAAALAFLAWKVATRGVAGATSDIVSGMVGGVFDAAGGVIGGAYTALPDPIKPSSDRNIVYQAASLPVRMLPGSSSDETLGTWLYNITHPNEKF